MVPDDLESSCSTVSAARTMNNLELDWFPILALYCCDNSEGKVIGCTRQGMTVRTPCARRLSTLEDIQQRRSMKARNMADACQVRAKTEDLQGSLAVPGHDIMM